MAKTIHSMIRVMNEARSVPFYEKAFGLSVAERPDFPEFTRVCMSNPEQEFEVELTVKKDRSQPYDMGDGYGHLAVSVDDLEAGYDRFEAEGFATSKLVEFAPAGEIVTRVFFATDPGGYQTEVLER